MLSRSSLIADNLAWTRGKHTFKMGLFLEKFQ